MNNSKKLEISKNDISIKNDIPSQYEKAEKNTMKLHYIFDECVDFNDPNIEAYWSCFELSVSEQERIFSDKIHPDDALLLWDYVIVNFFRLKVLGEQEYFLDKKFFKENKENKEKTENQTNENNRLIDLENKKQEYFWKIELDAVGLSISNKPYQYIDKIQDKKLDSNKLDANKSNDMKFDESSSEENESKFIHRLSLLYRAIYSLLTQDQLFEHVLSSSSSEIVSSVAFLDHIVQSQSEQNRSEIDQSEKITSTAKSFVQNFLKNSIAIERGMEVQLHKKFFALCFFVSFAQLQDMWRSLFIGHQLTLARENAELFIERFNLYTDSVSAILGKTLTLFSSVQQENALFDPKTTTLYNRVFTKIYNCISQRNPSFVSFTPHENLTIIDRAEIFWVESLRSRLKYRDGFELDLDKKINQQDKNQQNINKKEFQEATEQKGKLEESTLFIPEKSTQKIHIKESGESGESADESIDNYIVDELESSVTEMKTNFISIRMTLYESFQDYFEHMISSEEKFYYRSSHDSLQTKDKYQEDLYIYKNERLTPEEPNQEKLKTTIDFTNLLERAKRKSFQLYNWNDWSKIEKYSIHSFLQPQIFERKVTAEATTDVSATKILPCHLLFTNEELEITLLIYQQRLLLQILGDVSTLEVKVDNRKLSSFEVPPEYMGLGFLWYELPKKPPKQIRILYKTQRELDSTVQILSETSQIHKHIKNKKYIKNKLNAHEIVLNLHESD